MLLRELMGNAAPDVDISALAYSSESVAPGALFFCVPGFRADGHDFAAAAAERGAVALVCERSLGLGVPEVIVPDVRAAMPAVAVGAALSDKWVAAAAEIVTAPLAPVIVPTTVSVAVIV